MYTDAQCECVSAFSVQTKTILSDEMWAAAPPESPPLVDAPLPGNISVCDFYRVSKMFKQSITMKAIVNI